ncbi:MAG: hypothetical protein RQ714_04130 [Nitrosomonas sp.]|nr:hypothetical protein [Nitrosomonas sp.]
MSLKKWDDEKLAVTRDEIEAWTIRHAKSLWSGKMGILIGLLGAFAVSTGVVFLFFDGFDVMSLVLIMLGSLACFTWYKTDKQLKTNTNFLTDIKTEITRRTRKQEQESDH